MSASAQLRDPAQSAEQAHSDEAHAGVLLSHAAKTLESEPLLLAFFQALYRNAAPEDINRYTPEALAALASLVFVRARTHKQGESFVDLFSPRDQSNAYERMESV